MGRRNVRRGPARRPFAPPGRSGSAHETTPERRARALRPWVLVAGTLLVAAVAVAAGIGLSAGRPSSAAATPPGVQGTIVKGVGGQWLDVTPGTLAAMLETKDFTLLNVKAPYIGEIAGTDVYIPYSDLGARVAELPANRASPIVVYCRTGHQSAIAAQTLLDLGYTDVVNLAGGMEAWVSSGRALVQQNRG